MAKQRHDLGVQKRLKGQQRLSPNEREWQRLKRRLPGPLPWYILDFGEWVKRGKPNG